MTTPNTNGEAKQVPVDLDPPYVIVREEMTIRDWSDEDLIAHSGATAPIEVCSLELFLACDPREMECPVRLGETVCKLLASAFGTSIALWENLDEGYMQSLARGESDAEGGE